MKKRGKAFSFVLIFAMILQMFTICAYAQPSSSEPIVFQRNEYEAMKALEKEGKIDGTFRETMKAHLYEMKLKDSSELKALGYTDTQINAIKAFDGSDEMMALASASVEYTIDIKSYTYSSSKNISEAKVKIDYKWSGMPAFKSKDVLGFAWSNDFDVDLNKSYLKVTYTNANYPNTIKQVTYDIDEIGLNLAEVVFPLHETKGTGSDLIGLTGLKGTGYVYFTKAEKINVFKLYSSYGHTRVNINPGVDIGTSGLTGGITFTTGTSNETGMSDSMSATVV